MVILEQGGFQPNMTGVLMKRENLDRDIHAGRYHIKMKAEIRAMHLETKERQRFPANPQKLGESLGLILPRSLKRK